MQLCAYILLLFFWTSEGHKILVYNSKFGHSHSNFLGSIADILVEAGHNVTSLIPEIDTTLKDGTTKSTIIRVKSEAAAKERIRLMTGKFDVFGAKLIDPYFSFEMGRIYGAFFATNCRTLLEHDNLVESLKAEKFDVFIAENFDMCGTGLSHVIEAKSIILVTASTLFGPQFDEFGVPPSLSFNPSSYMSSMNVYSMWDRIVNIFAHFLRLQFFREGRENIEAVFKERFGNTFPSLEEISSRAAYIITNSEPLLDFASPTLERVINIGGIGVKSPHELDDYWLKILERREKNVLISFGSLAKSKDLRIEIKQAILKTFRRFPDVTFIWKYENLEDEFVKTASAENDNLIFSSWTPQSDILAHDKLTVFITHGGMGSIQETAARGVPCLLIPLFGDQPRNAAAIQHNGLGKVYDKFDMDNDKKLSEALEELLFDKGYKKRAIRMSSMLASKPFTAKELLIKHVEFAAQFGPSSSLRPQSHDMSFIAYHNLDITLLTASIISCTAYLLAHMILKYLCYKLAADEKEKIA